MIEVGRTSLKVGVEIFVEQMYEEHRELAINGVLTFVAIDHNKKPVRILEYLEKNVGGEGEMK